MDDDQQFCLRWNNHQSTLVSVFDTLLEKGIHVDCTLAAEGQTLKAHKVVLSACSPYFENVLSQQYDKHPIIILKDVKYAELKAMMDYMYRGEVNISQDQLAALLKAAESLQIKGLSDNKPSRPPSRPAPPAAPPALPAHPAHPPRAASPPPQPRDGSVDSREGSESPSRRRKKARRPSSASPAPDPAVCKQESPRERVEDLTLDEEADEPPAVTHNDVVRNFQWHMERSQDEIMNSSDSIRDSQESQRATSPQARDGIVTRSKKTVEEPSTATTFAILKNVITSPFEDDVKEEPAPSEEARRALFPLAVKQPPALPALAPLAPPAPPAPPAPAAPRPPAPRKPAKAEAGEVRKEARYLFPARAGGLSCAQFKTDKGFKCPNCSRCYNARRNLVRHVTQECGREPQFKCPYCAYSKHRRNEVRKHVERKHPDHYKRQAPSPVPV